MNQDSDHVMSLIEKFEYDKARIILETNLKKDENNVELLDLYSEVLINLDHPEEAKKV